MSWNAAAADREEEDDPPTGLIEPLLLANDSGGLQFHPEVKNKQAEAKDDRYWVDVRREPNATAAADPESGDHDGGRPLMFREKKVKPALLYTYRALILVRLIAVTLFIGWRIKHNHYWRRVLRLVPEALGEGTITLGEGFA